MEFTQIHSVYSSTIKCLIYFSDREVTCCHGSGGVRTGSMEVNKAQKSHVWSFGCWASVHFMLVKNVEPGLPDNLVPLLLWWILVPGYGSRSYIPARNHHDLHLPAAAHNMRLRLRKVLLAGRENDPSGIWLFVAFVGMALETYLKGVQ